MKSHIVILLIAALLGAPAGLAGWAGMGATEPDTAHDVNDGWMFLTPDASPCSSTSCAVNQVYLNGFVSTGGATGNTGNPEPNPNAATVGTGTHGEVWVVFALLGVWKDCNRDGFIGLGDQGLFEYRSALLLDSSVCPAGSIPATIPLDWVPPHNDGSWVHEFLPISWPGPYNTPGGDIDKFNINDAGARAWYDYFPPEAGAGGRSCWVNPPTGSLHSTGGFLFWADCLDGYRATPTFDSIADNQTALQPYSFSDVDANPATQNEYYASHSKANVENPWGWEYEGSYASAWDCSKPPLASVAEPTTPTSVGGVVTVNPTYVNVSSPRVPPALSPTAPSVGATGPGPLYSMNGASPAGTANATGAGLDRCDRRTDSTGGGRGGGLANDPYAAEAAVSQSTAVTQPKGVLVGAAFAHRPGYCPATSSTGDGSCAQVGPVDDNVGQFWDGALGRGTPPGLGEHVVDASGNSKSGFWYDAISYWISGAPYARFTVTTYAYVSPQAIQQYGLCLPKDAPACGIAPTVGTYGQEWCQGATTGVVNGWDCDRSHWWKNTVGQDASQRSPYLGPDPSIDQTATPCYPGGNNTAAASTAQTTRGCIEVSPYVGDPYDLRDVDCYDDLPAAARDAANANHVFPVTGAGPVDTASLGVALRACGDGS